MPRIISGPRSALCQDAVSVYGQYETFGAGEPYGQSAAVVIRLANGALVDSWLSY